MWCPGCGNGIVLGALLRAFEELGYENKDTVVVTGIGCWGKADDYLVTNALHVTHGRALAFATGIKAFKPELNVVVLMGDGDSVTIGGNHFIHAARRNIDLTAVIVNNFNYGMTGGQVSATTLPDKYTSTTVYGNPEREFDICALAGVAGANYVARETVYNGWELQQFIKEGLTNKGFSVVEAISPCPTHFGRYNKLGGGLAMLRWLKEKSFAGEKEDSFSCGRLVDRNAPDFNTRYREIQARALKAGNGGS
ncbi:MAG TPA: thiamine pyrophosphate-dependent enzyme [Spirochaetia bacterium]|nr:thiamine pyrophosphate-dependent enzyme [Spirochaetia bacterium]